MPKVESDREVLQHRPNRSEVEVRQDGVPGGAVRTALLDDPANLGHVIEHRGRLHLRQTFPEPAEVAMKDVIHGSEE